EDGAARPDGRLGDLARRDRGVPLDGELELDPRILQLPFELRELLLRVTPDRIADLEVPALHLKLHEPSLGACAGPESSGRPARRSRPRPGARRLSGAPTPRRSQWRRSC